MTAPGTAAYSAYELRRTIRSRQLTAVAIASAANFTVDSFAGPVQRITLTEDTTCDAISGDGFSVVGSIITLIVVQDGTGTWTLTFASAFRKASADVLTASAGALDITVYQLHAGVPTDGTVLVQRLALDVGAV